MQTADNLKEYSSQLREALDNEFQRGALERFAVAYPTGRANAFKGMDAQAMIKEVAGIKDRATANMDELYEQFKAKAESIGIHVHMAKTAHEANEIIAKIAKDTNSTKVVKAKSMTAEETLLNHHLEAQGMEIVETDLGEWIIQLRHEGPSHMVMPAIHLSRYQVKDLFSKVTGKEQEADVHRLVKVARRELRQRYHEADKGVTGANFAIADTATLGLVTNEGNARLVTTLPRVHVALVGLEKLIPSMDDALKVLKVLPRNATGQQLTSYVTWITGAVPAGSGETREMHIVFMDNGRRALADDPKFSQVKRSIRCGACANVCPVYRMVGGHKYGHIYIGAIGLILTYFFHGRDKAKNLVRNCINCQACKAICAADIDLPKLIKDIFQQIQDEDGHELKSSLMAKAMRNRTLFHGLLKAAKFASRPLSKAAPRKGETAYLRHLPFLFDDQQNHRELPALADTSFRDMWPGIEAKMDAKDASGKLTVALFGGCVQDFVYPEQLKATVDLLRVRGVKVDFPMRQTCCGLPLQMMGEKKTAKDIARDNITAIDPAEYDFILAPCASCASQFKHNYPDLLHGDELSFKARQFADKVISVSALLKDELKLTAEDFGGEPSGDKVAYHAPCHLCRGMDVHEQPGRLIKDAGCDHVVYGEEEVCCGFGGSYSMNFPDVSNALLDNKLRKVGEAGAATLVTECPGCVMQLRGGAAARKMDLQVRHLAELLADKRSD